MARLRGWMIRRSIGCATGLVDELPVAKLLDVGCGDGRFTAHLVNRNPGMSAVAIDNAEPHLLDSWRRLAGPRLRFEIADVYQLPFEDNSFGMVTAFAVLQHLEDPHLALREIRRVCRGWLVATVPWEPWEPASKMARRVKGPRPGTTPKQIHHWTRRGFHQLLEPHGRIDELRGSTVWSLARVRLDQHAHGATAS